MSHANTPDKGINENEGGRHFVHRISKVEVLEGYRLELTFANGTRGTVDLSRLAGKGVFSIWNDREAFCSVRIGPAGELAWGDGIDLCPDSLYFEATGQSPEEAFPGLKRERVHA